MEKKKLSWKEFTWYIIAGVLALFGFSLVITHIVGYYQDVTLEDNAVYQAEQKLISSLKINLDFMGWGFIFVLIGLIMAVVVLYRFAKKDDAVRERDIKRKQRLAEQLKEMEEPKIEETKVEEKTEQVEVVEVDPADKETK